MVVLGEQADVSGRECGGRCRQCTSVVGTLLNESGAQEGGRAGEADFTGLRLGHVKMCRHVSCANKCLLTLEVGFFLNVLGFLLHISQFPEVVSENYKHGCP